MNQEKIGKFIAKCRKNKNLTQALLAEKLGVSDRSVSKWENGKCMPDWSLIKPLCQELDISINELLSGELLNEDELKEKSELNLLNTINYTEKKIDKIKKIFKSIIIISTIFLVLLITLFLIDIKRMNENKEVFFSTWGFDYTPPIDLSNEQIELAILDYLIEKGDNEYKHHDTEKTFASMKIYLIEEESKSHYNIYAFVLQEKYIKENDEVIKDSGFFIPHKFVVEVINREYVVINSIVPRDGTLYKEDMKSIFPKSVLNDIDKVYQDGTIERLSLDIKKQVDLYFHR